MNVELLVLMATKLGTPVEELLDLLRSPASEDAQAILIKNTKDLQSDSAAFH